MRSWPVGGLHWRPRTRKTGDVDGVVLDVGFQNAQAVMFGGEGTTDGGGMFFRSGQFRRAGVGAGLDEFDAVIVNH